MFVLRRTLQTFRALEYGLWRHLDVVSIVGAPIPELVEMRDRYDLTPQLCSDEDLSAARQYGGIEQTSNHGEIPISATYVVDEDRTVRYEQIAENPADRTYANYVLAFIRGDFKNPYEG